MKYKQNTPVKFKKCTVENCLNMSTGYKNNLPYCNKHWLRIHLNGTTHKVGKKIKTKYQVLNSYCLGISSNGTEFKFSLEDWGAVTKHSWIPNKSGYLVATIDQKVVRLNRFILKQHQRVFKNMVVDHINGDIKDNRLENLRMISPKNNARNLGVSKNNTSGTTGVSKVPSGNFIARIVVNRKEIKLGTFANEIEAIHARKKAEKKYYGKFARSSQ